MERWQRFRLCKPYQNGSIRFFFFLPRGKWRFCLVFLIIVIWWCFILGLWSSFLLRLKNESLMRFRFLLLPLRKILRWFRECRRICICILRCNISGVTMMNTMQGWLDGKIGSLILSFRGSGNGTWSFIILIRWFVIAIILRNWQRSFMVSKARFLIQRSQISIGLLEFLRSRCLILYM